MPLGPPRQTSAEAWKKFPVASKPGSLCLKPWLISPMSFRGWAKKLKVLSGHLKQDWYLTKFRKNFAKAEMTHDIGLVDARYQGQSDELEYVSILPTSPP